MSKENGLENKLPTYGKLPAAVRSRVVRDTQHQESDEHASRERLWFSTIWFSKTVASTLETKQSKICTQLWRSALGSQTLLNAYGFAMVFDAFASTEHFSWQAQYFKGPKLLKHIGRERYNF